MAAKMQGRRKGQDALDKDSQGRGEANGGGLMNLNEEQTATALGWFSIGLGVAEVVAPRGLSKLIGIKENHDTLVRLLGLREIASGIGILTQRRTAAAWLWARVAGDAIDLACLGAAFASRDADPGKIAAAVAAVAGVAVADVLCAQQLSSSNGKTNAERSETATMNDRPSTRSAAAGR
jgi:hypothetical protein